jgi:hypothetical protein
MTPSLDRASEVERIDRRWLVVLLLAAAAVAGWIGWRAFSTPELEDGEHFVFVTAFEPTLITVDPALFFSGEEALAAARDDGVIGPSEELPNPFYVRNPEAERVILDVAGSFHAKLINAVTLEFGAPVDANGFANLFQGAVIPDPVYGFTPDGFPMVIAVEGGEVTAATQQYIP